MESAASAMGIKDPHGCMPLFDFLMTAIKKNEAVGHNEGNCKAVELGFGGVTEKRRSLPPPFP